METPSSDTTASCDLQDETTWQQVVMDEPISPQLCSQCRTLQLTIDSFVTSNEKAPGSPRRKLTQQVTTLFTGAGDGRIQCYAEILANQETCAFCRLLVKAVKIYDALYDNQRPEQASFWLRWEIDSQGDAYTVKPLRRTRRLRVIWQHADTRRVEAFLVLCTKTDLQEGSMSSISSRLSRQMIGDRGFEIQRLAMIKRWLDICDEQHDCACGIPTQPMEFYKLAKSSYFGVIDVNALQLIALPVTNEGLPEEFAALSYIWGTQPEEHPPYVTTTKNIRSRQEHGGLRSEVKHFPTVIQDTIKLLQQLNIRYLWIDALCIVQDSKNWSLNAEHMHLIYGNARLTICAADGSSAWTGLVALQVMPAMYKGLEDDLLDTVDNEEVLPGLRLQVTRAPEVLIAQSEWAKRGWTYQERILSRRCIIFAEGGVYYECRKAASSEDAHNDIKDSSWPLQSLGAPSHNSIEIGKRAFSFYMKSMSEYYGKNLTRSEDILIAFKGLESIMALVLSAPFSWGLPTSHLDLALLWQPRKALTRRVESLHQEHCASLAGYTCDCSTTNKVDLDGTHWPSWSWCGWSEGSVEYNASALAGALISVHDWLSQHTWIKYHIIDGRGRLRPLWHRHYQTQDCSEESRWQGYAGVPVVPKGLTARRRRAYLLSSTEETAQREMLNRPESFDTASTGYEFLLTRALGHRQREKADGQDAQKCGSRADQDGHNDALADLCALLPSDMPELTIDYHGSDIDSWGRIQHNLPTHALAIDWTSTARSTIRVLIVW